MNAERCAELFLSGYNCAQAVAGGFAEAAGLTEEKALALASCFGAGTCGTRNTCGAVNGALIILGAVLDKTSADDKKQVYEEGRKLIEEFEKKFSTVVCKELLTKAKAYFAESPLPRTESYYKARPCLVFVKETAEWLENKINEIKTKSLYNE